MSDLTYREPWQSQNQWEITDAQPAPLSISTGKIIVLILLQILLAYLSKQSSIFSTLYAMATFSVAFMYVLSDKTSWGAIYAAAYITGAELIWRGTEAAIFYESGKYAVTGLLLIAILKHQLLKPSRKIPLLYFLLLLPSISVMPVFDRQLVSFNLSGPLALAVAAIFFSTQRFTRQHLKRTMFYILLPGAGLGFLAAFSTLTTENLEITGVSNFVTSAGIGPNQMSSALSLGALGAFYYGLLETKNRQTRWLMFGITLWLFFQAMLTFSRGGVWTTAIAVVLALFFLLQNRRTRSILIAASLIIGSLGYFVIFPYLDNFTSGALAERFADTESTGRVDLVKADWQIFLDHLPLGIGPGQSIIYHTLMVKRAQAHTEYSRLLAEHGIPGLLALILLGLISAGRFLSRVTAEKKTFQVLLTSWALLFMLHSAMRMVAPSFLFGLAAADLELEDQERA